MGTPGQIMSRKVHKIFVIKFLFRIFFIHTNEYESIFQRRKDLDRPLALAPSLVKLVHI